MKKFLIIGGGLSGLMAAKNLQETGVDWVGLERGEQLGGRILSSVPRVQDEVSKGKLQTLFPTTEWEFIEDVAVEAKKGAWVEQASGVEPWEAYFSRAKFFRPAQPTADWFLQSFTPELLGKFETDKTAVRVSLEQKKVWCSDGSEYEYERALWCAPLADFFKCCSEASAAQWKIPKNRRELGAVVLQMHLNKLFTTNKNSIGISFRFGDGKARATGTPLFIDDNKQVIYWTLYLEEALSENKEEVAHCLRNFKRELFRQFPDLDQSVESERIIYLSRMALDEPLAAASLELGPDFSYLGSEVRLKDSPKQLAHMDLVMENFSRLFEKAETPSEPAQPTSEATS